MREKGKDNKRAKLGIEALFYIYYVFWNLESVWRGFQLKPRLELGFGGETIHPSQEDQGTTQVLCLHFSVCVVTAIIDLRFRRGRGSLLGRAAIVGDHP